jgi:hypothetical protein
MLKEGWVKMQLISKKLTISSNAIVEDCNFEIIVL